MAHGQEVTVSYTVSSTSAILDAVGNDAAGLTDEAVTNNTAETANRAPAFADTTLTRSVPENSAAGTHVGAAIPAATDADWTERYNITPVLIETFVETPRYTGVVYRASSWTRVGTTQGRGRYDRHTKQDQPKKDIWLRPLRKDWQRTLNR